MIQPKQACIICVLDAVAFTENGCVEMYNS